MWLRSIRLLIWFAHHLSLMINNFQHSCSGSVSRSSTATNFGQVLLLIPLMAVKGSPQLVAYHPQVLCPHPLGVFQQCVRSCMATKTDTISP